MKTTSFFQIFGKPLFVLLLVFGGLEKVQAQVSLSGPYSQNFDDLPIPTSSTVFFNNSTIPGWYAMQNGVAATSIAGGDGNSGTTGLRSFGTSSDRALGGVRSTGDFYYGVHLKNTTGSTINSFTIQYTVEQWSQPGNKNVTNVEFDYNRTINLNTTTGWNTVTNSNVAWAAPTGKTTSTDGNTVNEIKSFTANIVLNDGEEVIFRWKETNTNGYYLALDDVQIIPNLSTTPAPTSIYYSKPSGSLDVTTSWVSNPDGTGFNNPNNFSGAIFIIANRTTATIGNNWTLGTNAKVIVGEGVTFSIPSTHSVSGTVDLSNNATIELNNNILPTLGILPDNSTVHYKNSNTSITSRTYGSLIIGSNKTLSTGTLTVKGTLSVNSGNIFNQTGGTLNVIGILNAATGTYNFSNGTVVFNAASGTQNVPGLSYYNLTIAGAGTRQLLANTTVKGVLNFNGPQLIAAEPITLTLDNAGSITNETPTSCFKGKLVKSEIINGAADRTFGGMGLRFVNTTGNWGTVTVTRTTDAYQKNPKDDTKQSIKRSWNIQPSTQAGTNVNLTFNWLTSEDNGQNYGSPTMQAQPWKSTDGGTTWIPVGNLVTITTNGDVRTASVTTNSFSVWTWSGINNPLPVTWLSFNGKTTANGNLLTWATASEKNSENFIVERSENGKTFEAIGTVKAAGNSSQVLNYQFTDKHPLTNATAYYRLKQTDTDGAYDYSAIIAIAKNDRFVQVLNAYPNPFGQTIHLQLAEGHTAKKVVLLTLEGKEVYSKVLTSATETVLNDLPELKAGIYFLQLTGENETTTLKVMRQ